MCSGTIINADSANFIHNQCISGDSIFLLETNIFVESCKILTRKIDFYGP